MHKYIYIVIVYITIFSAILLIWAIFYFFTVFISRSTLENNKGLLCCTVLI